MRAYFAFLKNARVVCVAPSLNSKGFVCVPCASARAACVPLLLLRAIHDDTARVHTHKRMGNLKRMRT